MQGSKVDTFVKLKKQQKLFDDGTGKRQNNKKDGYHKQMRQRHQDPQNNS